MDLKAAKALLETLIFAIEQAVHLNDKNALILINEFFRVIFAQEKELVLEVLHQILGAFEE
jgi:hypothetical protein